VRDSYADSDSITYTYSNAYGLTYVHAWGVAERGKHAY
jgi:hypothetical protein